MHYLYYSSDYNIVFYLLLRLSFPVELDCNIALYFPDYPLKFIDYLSIRSKLIFARKAFTKPRLRFKASG